MNPTIALLLVHLTSMHSLRKGCLSVEKETNERLRKIPDLHVGLSLGGDHPYSRTLPVYSFVATVL